MMKNYLSRIVFLLLSITAVVSCSKDEENAAPVITGMYTSASQAVYGQSLSVNAYVKDDAGAIYTWSCSGGQISGSGKTVTWIAPQTCGKYQITLTLTAGDEVISSVKEVEVLGNYYHLFNETSTDWGYNSSYTARTLSNGILSLKAVTSTNYASYAYKANNSTLPFSAKTSIAVALSDNTSSSSCLRLGLKFPTDSTLSSSFDYLYLYIYPTANKWALKAGMKTGTSVEYQNIDSVSYSNSKSIFNTSREYHTISMSIAANKTIFIYLDGQELCSSTALLTNPLYNRAITISEYIYNVSPGLELLVDDFCYATDGTILK